MSILIYLNNVLPKPKPPSFFLDSLEENYMTNDQCFDLLAKSDYSKFNLEFLEMCSTNIKKVPFQNHYLDLKSFLIFLKKFPNQSILQISKLTLKVL